MSFVIGSFQTESLTVSRDSSSAAGRDDVLGGLGRFALRPRTRTRRRRRSQSHARECRIYTGRPGRIRRSDLASTESSLRWIRRANWPFPSTQGSEYSVRHLVSSSLPRQESIMATINDAVLAALREKYGGTI